MAAKDEAPREPQALPYGAARRRLDDGGEDLLVREEPLWIRVGEAQLLTMRTPGDDEYLVLGFLLGEGVIERPEDVVRQTFTAGDASKLLPDACDVELRPGAAARVGGRLTRTHEVRPSCGVCGLTDAAALLDELPPLLPGVPRVPVPELQAMQERFAATQECFRVTGACHGAVIYGGDGQLWGSGEDVGRHNALDKAIGRAARGGHELARGVALLSGRAGYELVLKCLRVRIPVIASVSAATALSFDLCRAAGATLVGFLRDGRCKVYCDPGRLLGRG